MDTTPSPVSAQPAEPNQNAILDTSTRKIFGVPRRAIAFGFGSFLMLVVLAVLYGVFTRQPGPMPGEMPIMMPSNESMQDGAKPEMTKQSVPAVVGEVTPDRVADDLIDEALSDRDDLSNYDSDEMADVEDGSNN